MKKQFDSVQQLISSQNQRQIENKHHVVNFMTEAQQLYKYENIAKIRAGEVYQMYCYDYNIEQGSDYSPPTINLFGYIEEEQRKINISVVGFDIYLDVWINYALIGENKVQEPENAFLNTILNNIKHRGYNGIVYNGLYELVSRYEFIKIKNFRGYIQNQRDYKHSHIRFYFKTFRHYDSFKKVLSNENLQYEKYCEDDRSSQNENIKLYFQAKENGISGSIFQLSEDDNVTNYICKLQRQHEFVLSGWNTVIFSQVQYISSQNMQTTLSVVANIDKIKQNPALSDTKCNQMGIMTWDIEVSTQNRMFDNDAANLNNNILCIGISFTKQDKTQRYVLTYLPCQAEKCKKTDTMLILTSNEKQMIICFFEVIAYLNPAIITGFNDFKFDWSFLRDRINLFSCSTEIEQFLYSACNLISRPKTSKTILFDEILIKINAQDQKKGICLALHGIICVDTMIVLIKSQKIEKSTLNDYLKVNGLELKHEISFAAMNDCYDKYMTKQEILDSDSHLMFSIMDYCAYDADACRLLWAKRNVLQEHQELANLSFTPLRYAFNNANGIKVRNMVAYYAYKQGFSVPMGSGSGGRRAEAQLLKKYGKYPGAYVPAPKKGINKTPIIALDFASLYPSIIMAHNLSPENVVVSNKGNLAEKDGSERISITFGDDNQDVITGSIVPKSINIGLYPTILQKLFADRKKIKAQIDLLGKQLKTSQNEQERDNLSFQIKHLDAKQYALKIYMNTFYGEAGNQNSPFFDLIVAAGTTMKGREYITQVHQMVTNMDCEVIYGDTDSIYLRPRVSHYKYDKSITMTDIIAQSIQIAEQLKQQINAKIGAQTNNILRMEFEEVLCPSMFMGKKKYCGIKHTPDNIIHKSKIQLNTILIKGIDYIKSQYPQLVKDAGNNLLQFMMESFALDQIKSADIVNLFSDEQRPQNNEHLKQITVNYAVEFNKNINAFIYELYQIGENIQRLQSSKAQNSQKIAELKIKQLKMIDNIATRKKYRKGAKTGEMVLFMDRVRDTYQTKLLMQDIRKKGLLQPALFTQFIETDWEEVGLQIDENELRATGIEIPTDGEIVKILYVINAFAKKTSQKMHLAEYVQQKNLQIDQFEYQEMFNTTVKRLLACCFDGNTENELINQAKQLLDTVLPKKAINIQSNSLIAHYKDICDDITVLIDSLNPQIANMRKQFSAFEKNVNSIKNTSRQKVESQAFQDLLISIQAQHQENIDKLLANRQLLVLMNMYGAKKIMDKQLLYIQNKYQDIIENQFIKIKQYYQKNEEYIASVIKSIVIKEFVMKYISNRDIQQPSQKALLPTKTTICQLYKLIYTESQSALQQILRR